ncbi:hypothetical protein [Echinimonas agarilytica]|uniref:Phage shock protein B n=1 Tax=Echinimonas agarilytica TaxID=1215918 RepID=A0AA41W6X5_9GAMM|nr:hypothetical protein [Echinimonas agarilytica]MCM2680112.1 hypothetical protein [Echinimonas agarilytica]
MSVNTILFLGMIFAFVLAQQYLETRHKKESSKHKKDNDKLREELDNAITRIETLERIVTDDGYDLKKEIEGLKRRA